MTDLPPGWEATTTDALLDFVTSGSRGWARHYSHDGALFIRVGNLRRGSIAPNFADVQRVSPPEGAEGSRTRVAPNDILISITADLGRVALMADVREPTYVNQHIALARPRPGVNARYLAWYLTSESVQRHWARQQRGVTKLGLGLHDIRSIGVPLPPLAEQERIVAAIEERISRVDAAVLALQDVKQKLTRMRAAVLQDVVVRSKAMADELPIRDLLREPLRNGHSAKAHPNGTVPILTLTAVTLGDFSERNLKMTIADPIKVSDLWLQPGDLLIERSNTRELVGTSRLYRGPRSLAIFPDLVIRARVDARILPEYAELVLQAPSSRRYFQRRAQGISGSMPKIDQSTVESLAIPVPPIEAQRELVTDAARQLTLIEAGEGAVSTAQQHSSALRSSILASAFCGRLVPQDPADEPASALLERIASERAASDGLRRSKYSGRVTKVTQ